MTTVYTDASAQNEAAVADLSVIDPNNTSIIPLGAGGVFTGVWTNALRYSQIQVLVFADVPSAANGLLVQFSTDGTNVDHTHAYIVNANVGETIQVHVHAPWFRIVYTNGATPQTQLRLQTILRPLAGHGTIVEVDDFITTYDDAILTKSVLTGQSTLDGAFVNVKTTSDGGLVVNQNTVVDPLSSTTVNLAAGATFSGPWVSDLNYTAVQYIVKASQNLLVYVDQSPDGVNPDISDVFESYTSEGGTGNTIQLVASYYRIRVTNVGLVATTFLRLQVIQVPFLPSLPRSLDLDGNLKVSIYDGITDESGFTAKNTPHGELISVPTFRLTGSSFGHTVLDSNIWSSVTGTGGTNTIVGGELVMSTGTTANNAVSVATVKAGRFVGGTANSLHFLVRLSDSGATANNTRRGGAYNATNGVFFTVVNGLFSLVTRLNSVDTYINNGSFNGDLGVTVALTNQLTDFGILYTVDTIWFFMGGQLLHKASFPTSNWSSVYSLPITFENINTGGSTTNVSMNVRNATIQRYGSHQTEPISFFQQGLTAGVTLKYGAGNMQGIVLSGITNNSVVTFYDNTAASGTVIWTSGALTSNGLPFFIDMKGIQFSTGLTIAITGAALNVLTMYE